MHFLIRNESELAQVIPPIFELQPKGIYLFYGDLGAGKTTFIKHLLHHLSVVENVSSPTYNLIHEYTSTDGKKIVHGDFYRIRSIEEIIDLGWFDISASADYIFIEWPEQLLPLLDESFLNIKITLNPIDKIRTISLYLNQPI